ncbi:hypothetical protein GOODEAATRI_030330, partial [Goodea atripinnis]
PEARRFLLSWFLKCSLIFQGLAGIPFIMLNGVALRSQIASVIDALAKAAVAEIFKVVEDGMVVLRLEMCQREDEIERLKSSMEVLHGELRAARQAETQRPEHRGGDGESCRKHILLHVRFRQI